MECGDLSLNLHASRQIRRGGARFRTGSHSDRVNARGQAKHLSHPTILSTWDW